MFRKNVRQSLGNSNKVNKAIAQTIKKDARDFFFLHNGITAICSHMELKGNHLSVKELNVVNGCQSLSTIYSSSETAKKATDAYILFRFYEISESDRADKISTSTNSQSAVKARDLRSNDKSVLALKKAYEQFYPDGYFITKRGEKVDKLKYNDANVVNLTDLGKQLIAWQSQRPTMEPDFWIETISYRETREYVARVLSFSTIYDWRLNGDALKVSDRLLGNVAGTRQGFICPAEAPRPLPRQPGLRRG